MVFISIELTDLYFARASFVHFPIGNFAQNLTAQSINQLGREERCSLSKL